MYAPPGCSHTKTGEFYRNRQDPVRCVGLRILSPCVPRCITVTTTLAFSLGTSLTSKRQDHGPEDCNPPTLSPQMLVSSLFLDLHRPAPMRTCLRCYTLADGTILERIHIRCKEQSTSGSRGRTRRLVPTEPRHRYDAKMLYVQRITRV